MTARRPTNTASVRCAIYTRTSSDESLDQAFNSLDAQREFCEAYVASQAGEGWRVMGDRYDDGGFSGGDIARPALQRLLAEVAAGRLDTVVVYKIDRLTRSLGDFARIVEQFDAAKASFVSVTQAFNTTTSMGRLTLNVLLSFAQFEREVTGERIRDKIAASKQKGLWMGGSVPLGYDPPAAGAVRVLDVNLAEAETVRLIFRTYLELGSVTKLVDWLNVQGIKSKRHVPRDGRTESNGRFQRGALYHLLSNRLYIGEVTHKGARYPGQHSAIVDRDLFENAQARLAAASQARGTRPTRAVAALFRGLVFDAAGNPMSPSFGRSKTQRLYRYYVSAPLQQGRAVSLEEGAISRAPAAKLEAFVLAQLSRLAPGLPIEPTPSELRAVLYRLELHPDSLRLILIREGLSRSRRADLEDIARLQDQIWNGEEVSFEGKHATVQMPVRYGAKGHRFWIAHTDSAHSEVGKPDKPLIRALRKAHEAKRTAQSTNATVAASAYERRRRRLAFLAPDIQFAILEGRQPPSLTLECLIQGDIPLAWSDQRALLGFS